MRNGVPALSSPAGFNRFGAVLLVALQAISAPAIGGQTPAAPGAKSLAELQGRINAIIGQPKFALADWGIDVVSLDTGRSLVEHNACKRFVPASNAKLFTAALALDRLGPDYQIETSVYVTKKPDASGTVKGDLVIVGRGDPGFVDSGQPDESNTTLAPLVQLLSAKGIKRIRGDVIGDESYFSGPPFGAGWGWEDLQWSYGAEVSALSIDDNSVGLTVKPGAKAGLPCQASVSPSNSLVNVIDRVITTPPSGPKWISVYRPIGENTVYVSGRLPVGDPGYQGHLAIHQPAGLFVQLLRRSMANRGILISGGERVADWKYREASPLDLARLVLVGSVKSRPLGEIVKDMLKRSQNLYAQLLLLQVGAQSGLSEASTPPVAAAAESSLTTAGAPNVPAPKGPAPNPPAQAGDQLPPSTEELGVQAMNSLLKQISPCNGDALLEEGSGLSRRDMTTAASFVALLAWAAQRPWANVFREGLPIAGQDGTLERRMKDVAGAGNVRAKTGTLRFVNALSGYATTAAGERLAFSLLLNSYSPASGDGSGSKALDQVLSELVGFTGHT